jgi:hypothetical protein
MGMPDVDELLDQLEPAQLREWMAYALIEPFGFTDRLLAEVACLLYNINRKEGAEAINIDTFLPIDLGKDFNVEPQNRELTKREVLERLMNK